MHLEKLVYSVETEHAQFWEILPRVSSFISLPLAAIMLRVLNSTYARVYNLFVQLSLLEMGHISKLYAY